jgi:hypothetical protein
MGLGRGPLSLVSTAEELLGRKSSSSCLETENTAVGIRHADYAAPLNPKNLALTSPKIGGRSVGIVLSRTQTTEFNLVRGESKKVVQCQVLFLVHSVLVLRN